MFKKISLYFQKALRDEMSDIGGYSLSETLTRGIDNVDQSKMFEHGKNKQKGYASS